ncbi:MAG: hypothetical protein QOJ64_559 [Acidobacteriota bacterium]|jgi:hypothetical protein|nr:hypothetical protein [Acidobacteriota bacterium]
MFKPGNRCRWREWLKFANAFGVPGMRMSVFKSSILLILAVAAAGSALAQQDVQSRRFPVAYDKSADSLPSRMTISGKISKVDYAPPACGELIFAATVEVQLDVKVSGYNDAFVYLVVPCLYRPKGADTFLNRPVELTVTKQSENRQPCFYDRRSTSIDSRGLPYYCAERADLLKSIGPAATSDAVEFEGALEKGNSYRAFVICDRAGEWHTAVRPKAPYHHAARVEWLNLSEFPQLTISRNSKCQRRIVFQVETKRTVKVFGQNRWNTMYECRILSAD